ncbi:hypothetical protein Tco_1376041 [Tanacetum coccineum]
MPLLEANWHAKNKCIGHPQSKNPGKPLRKKAQQAFIQRRIKREKKKEIGKIASVISGIRILGARILDIVGSVCISIRPGEYVPKYKTTVKYFQRDVGASNGNSVDEKIISDGDKAFPKLNREQAIQEAEQIISDGDKADPGSDNPASKTGLAHDLLYHFTSNLEDAIYGPIEALLKGDTNDTWSRIRTLLGREIEIAVS